MNQLFQGVTAICVVGAIVSTVVAGCTFGGPTRTETTERAGTVQMSLAGVGISGTEYRLRNANFAISGSSVANVSSEDYLDVTTVQLTLRSGAYLVELGNEWNLERRTEEVYQTVDAVLLSDNPMAFTILDQETTQVSFQFETAGDVVNVGEGTLEVSIRVTERASVELVPGIAMAVGEQPPGGGHPAVVSGDLDGDGWPDIALAHGYTTGAIVLNRQNETFAPELLISESWWNVQSNVGASGVSLADLDLDGSLDYVFPIYGAHYSGQAIQLYKGDENGNHTIPSQVPNGLVYELSGANPMNTKVADFDHNGLPDIVSGSNNGTHTADLILQTSPWAFTPSFAYNQNGSANPQWIDIGDFNNDGWMDLVVPFLYGRVEVYLNTADGTGAMTYAGGYLSAHHSQVAVADFNGDGSQDIVVRSNAENHVDVLYNDGNGIFSNAAAFAVSGSAVPSVQNGPVRAGDIDGDGTMDLVVCSYSTSTVDVLLNDGLGSFHAAVPIVLDEPPFTLALDDFDQDGDIDVAVYTRALGVGDHLRVLWNRR